MLNPIYLNSQVEVKTYTEEVVIKGVLVKIEEDCIMISNAERKKVQVPNTNYKIYIQHRNLEFLIFEGKVLENEDLRYIEIQLLRNLKREVYRFKLSLPTTCLLPVERGSKQIKEFTGMLVDLSISGARVELDRLLTRGFIFNMHFELEGNCLMVKCRVMNSERVNEGVYHYGVQFIETNEILESLVYRYIIREQNLLYNGHH